MLRGLLHLACREYDAAIECCERGLETKAVVAAGRHIYARCLIAAGRFEEAYRQGVLSIELQPTIFPFYLMTLGVACLLRGHADEAVLVLRKAREMMPRLSFVAGMLAGALEADDCHEDAQRVVGEVRQLDPSLTVADVLRPYPTRDAVHQTTLAGFLKGAGLRDDA